MTTNQISSAPRTANRTFANRDKNRHGRSQNQFFQHQPRVNVLKHEDDFLLQLAIPGIDKKDVSIQVENGQLIVSHKADNKQSDKFLRKGFDLNGFSRSFDLPKNTDLNRIEAEFALGILSINLPIMEAAKPKTIKIK